jgi:internalin A
MAWLALDNTAVTNISFLTNLGHPFFLDLSYIPARNLTPLVANAGLTNIGYLIAPGIGLSNTAFMNVMTNLQGVSLAQDGVTSIGSFSNLFLLQNVNLASDLLTNISSLAGKTNINSLDISFNAIHDLSPLAGLTNLVYFHAAGNGFSNITALAGMTLLNNVDLHSNDLQNISALTNKTMLTSVDLSYNQITNVAPLGADGSLLFLNLSHNDLQVINPLTSLTSLSFLDLTYNWLILTNNSAASLAIQTLVAQNTTVAYLPQNSAALLAPALAGVHTFQFSISSLRGLTYQVQFTTNLLAAHWISLGNLTNTSGGFLFTDSTATNPIRFYRLLAQ